MAMVAAAVDVGSGMVMLSVIGALRGTCRNAVCVVGEGKHHRLISKEKLPCVLTLFVPRVQFAESDLSIDI